MKGFVGVGDGTLTAGTVIVAPAANQRIVVIRHATFDEARESAAAMGHDLVAVPGEHFYEAEFTTVPASTEN